ncbi:MAG: hypothetical protein ACK5OC_25310 [Pirellula sp.]|jgi:hypothetical protein|nr:hypothetical protein [Planctomycetota bacterium]
MTLRQFMMQHGENKLSHPRYMTVNADTDMPDCATNKPKLSPTAEAQAEVAIAKREAIERWENEGGEVLVLNRELLSGPFEQLLP